MTKISVQINQGQTEALLTEIIDIDDWLNNFVQERARVILERAKQSEHWTPAIVALAQEGGETDDWSVFNKIVEQGHIESAADRNARERAEEEERLARMRQRPEETTPAPTDPDQE